MKPHGTFDRYNTWRCRCQWCREAARRYRQAIRLRTPVEVGPTCPRCGDLCEADSINCPECGAALTDAALAKNRPKEHDAAD